MRGTPCVQLLASLEQGSPYCAIPSEKVKQIFSENVQSVEQLILGWKMIGQKIKDRLGGGR